MPACCRVWTSTPRPAASETGIATGATRRRRPWDRSSVGLSLTQLLWDGMAVQNEISRLGHDKLARWFEFLDATEQTALEAARAYQDVLRFRRLVELAEDSYVQHRYTFGQSSRAYAPV